MLVIGCYVDITGTLLAWIQLCFNRRNISPISNTRDYISLFLTHSFLVMFTVVLLTIQKVAETSNIVPESSAAIIKKLQERFGSAS